MFGKRTGGPKWKFCNLCFRNVRVLFTGNEFWISEKQRKLCRNYLKKKKKNSAILVMSFIILIISF